MSIASTAPAVASVAAAGRRAGGATVRLLLDLAMVAAVLLFLLLAVGPRVLPYRTVTMLTGSMAPQVPVGAMAIDVAEPVSALRPGQIVSFHAPEPGHPVVTHRVVSVQRRDGNVLIRTRGDANSGDDPWLAVVHGDKVWRVRAVVPVMGQAIRVLRTPAVHLLVAWVVPGALFAWLVVGLWRPSKTSGRRRARNGVEGGEPACVGEPVSSASPSSSLGGI